MTRAMKNHAKMELRKNLKYYLMGNLMKRPRWSTVSKANIVGSAKCHTRTETGLATYQFLVNPILQVDNDTWKAFVSEQLLKASIDDMVGKEENYHISLSRTHYIKVFQIEKIVNMLHQSVSSFSSFELELSKVSVYLNDDNSRQFLAIDVIDHCNQLLLLTSAVDKILGSFGLEKYYENPMFHFSVGSAPPGASLEKTVNEMNLSLAAFDSGNSIVSRLRFDAGNRSFLFPLRYGPDETKPPVIFD